MVMKNNEASSLTRRKCRGAVKSLAADVRQQQTSLWNRWSKGQEIMAKDLKGKADKG